MSWDATQGEHTAGPGSGVVESSQTRGSIDAIRTGENVGLTADNLAIAITTTMIVDLGSHCYRLLPRLRWEMDFQFVYEMRGCRDRRRSSGLIESDEAVDGCFWVLVLLMTCCAGDQR